MATSDKSVSGNVMIDIPTPQAPPPDPVIPSPPETFVVPTGATPSAKSGPTPGSPFIIPPVGQPPVQASTPASGSPAPPPKKNGGSALTGIFRFLMLILALGALAAGGLAVWKFLKASQPVTLTYWGLWESQAIIQPVIDAFEAENPNVKIEYVKQNHKEYRERLTSAIDRGEGPDVFRFHNTWLYMLRKQIEPAPATVVTGEEVVRDFYPVAVNDLVAGTTVYGLPLMIDGLGLYINDDLFSAAGVVPPATWGDLEQAVAIITAPTAEARQQGAELTTAAVALGTAGNVEHVSDIIALLLMQNGASLTNLTGSEAEEALIYYRKFADQADPLYTWNETFDNSILAFANGRVAMILAPSWRAFDIKTVNPSLRFRIFPAPSLPGNPVTWASYWVEGVSTRSENKSAAWQFVKYLTSAASAQKIFTEASKVRLFGEPYARRDLANLLTGDPYLAAYISQAENARSFPLASRTWDNGLNDQMIEYVTKGLDQMKAGGSAAETVVFINNGFTQVLSRYGLISATPGGQ
jgi:multiple sugar transport system substrate-binding protein